MVQVPEFQEYPPAPGTSFGTHLCRYGITMPQNAGKRPFLPISRNSYPSAPAPVLKVVVRLLGGCGSVSLTNVS